MKLLTEKEKGFRSEASKPFRSPKTSKSLEKQKVFQKKLTAMFVIALIVSLPIYSAAVFASSVTVHSFSVKGKDGVEGVRRPIDHLDIEVVVSIEGDEDLTNNVYYGNVGAFDCSEGSESIADAFKCKYEDPETGVAKVKKEHSFTVYFYTDEPKQKLDEKDFTYVVDGLEPRVVEFDIEPKLTNTGKFKVEYLIEDRSYRGSIKCSGIDRLEIYDESAIGEPIEKIPVDTTQCFKDGSEEIELEDKTGEVTLCAKARDKFGQSLPVGEFDLCRKVTIDKDEVKFVENSERLVDEDKLALTHFKDKSIKAEFSINISGEDLVEETVVGDFSALNNEENYKELKAERCDQIKKGIRICKWSLDDVKLTKDEAGEKAVVIKAKDEAGNLATKTITYNLQYDDVGPEVLSLKTDYEIDGKFYASSEGTTFTVEIKEDGAGLREEDVILHIGAQTKEATKCEKTTNVCKWEKVNIIGSGVIKAYISTDSKDRLGNAFQKRFEQEIIVDNTKPRVIDITIKPLEATAEVIRTGVSLGITAKLEEGNGIKATVDLSKIITGETNFETKCKLEEGYWVCKWVTKLIDIQGHIKGDIVFTFEDYAGNKVVKAHPIEVYGVEGVVGDFYELEINPKYITPIDKQVMKYLTIPVYYYTMPFELKYNNKCSGDDVEILSLSLDGEDCSQGAIVDYINMSNGYSGFLQFARDPKSIKEEWTQTDIGVAKPCYLKLIVRCDKKVYTTPEPEKIEFNIPILDSGEVGDNIIKEIESIKDEINKFDEFIAKLNRFFEIAKGICTIKGVFGSVLSVLSVIGGKIAVCIDSETGRVVSLGGCDVAEETTKVAHTGLAGTFESLTHILDGFCNFATCRGAKTNIPIVNKEVQFGGYWCNSLKEGIIKGIDSYAKEHPEMGGALDALYKQNARYFDADTLELSKKSMVFAVGCACVPGIIYNYNKYKQIKCMKAVCLRDMVPLGVPKEECEKQDAYNRCRYWAGQSTVPGFFELFISAPIKKVLNTITKPVATLFMILRWKVETECINYCQNPKALTDIGVGKRTASCTFNWASWCGGYASIVLLDAGLEIVHFAEAKDTMFEPEVDYCKILLEEENEQKSS